MTPQNPCDFLVIHYAPVPGQATSFAWVLLARSVADPGRLLGVIAAAGWQGRVRPEHREYLRALIEDWEQLRGQAAESLFQQAESLSASPLRFGTRGRAAFADLTREAQALLQS